MTNIMEENEGNRKKCAEEWRKVDKILGKLRKQQKKNFKSLAKIKAKQE